MVHLLRAFEKPLKRYLRRRQNMLVYSTAIVFCTTLTIITCRVVVPQSHIQERLAIWWASPGFIQQGQQGPALAPPVSQSQSIPPAYPHFSTGRQLDSIRTTGVTGDEVTRDSTTELDNANTLKKEIFSEEAYSVRLRGGRSSGNNNSPSSPRAPGVPISGVTPSSRVALLKKQQQMLSLGGRKHPFKDMALTLEERVDDLVSRLTLEEVLGQGTVVQGRPTPGVARLGVRPFMWSPECTHGQSLSPWATSFPENLGLAASFSPDLIRNVSNAIAIEMRARWNQNKQQKKANSTQGLACFGPTANLMRHPLWGKNKETFGEDPYLGGQMAASYVSGLQGNHPRYIRVAAGCKHFAAHSGPEARQGALEIKMSERDFQMTYLPSFKACVQSGVQTIVCTDNKINGVSPCRDRHLLTTVLREEWGFSGLVASRASPLRPRGVPTSSRGVLPSSRRAVEGVRAGCNLEVTRGERGPGQAEAVRTGNLTLEEVRENIKPIFRVRMRLGEFDPPTMTPYSDIFMTPLQTSKHREQALVAAMMSFVLLKNYNRTLPLWAAHKYSKVAVLGPFSNYTALGNRAPLADDEYTTTPLQGLGKLGPTAHAPGCHGDCKNYDAQGVQKAVSDAEIVFVCLGVAQEADRVDLKLPGKQLQLLQDAAKWKGSARLVLLLFSPGPVDISWARDSAGVDAILYCGLPGSATGGAIWRILTRTGRKSSPAARLPFTWPAKMDQVAPMEDYSMQGHTYRYLTPQEQPLYPFGYGLSYSTFKYTSMTISPKVVVPGKDVTVTVGIQNTGPFGAEEIIQLYMHWGAVAALAPRLQLVGYRRVYLNFGPEYHYTLTVKADQMAIWIDKEVKFAILPGAMTLYVGGQQPFQTTNVPSNILKDTFTITR